MDALSKSKKMTEYAAIVTLAIDYAYQEISDSSVTGIFLHPHRTNHGSLLLKKPNHILKPLWLLDPVPIALCSTVLPPLSPDAHLRQEPMRLTTQANVHPTVIRPVTQHHGRRQHGLKLDVLHLRLRMADRFEEESRYQDAFTRAAAAAAATAGGSS